MGLKYRIGVVGSSSHDMIFEDVIVYKLDKEFIYLKTEKEEIFLNKDLVFSVVVEECNSN